MVNPGSFTPKRKAFLESQKAGYIDAVATGMIDLFLSNVYRCYFKRFPPTLAHDVEPSNEDLTAVDDNVTDPEIPVPDPDCLSPTEYKEAEAKYKALQKTIDFRMKV
jgi:hypothetical protein